MDSIASYDSTFLELAHSLNKHLLYTNYGPGTVLALKYFSFNTVHLIRETGFRQGLLSIFLIRKNNLGKRNHFLKTISHVDVLVKMCK